MAARLPRFAALLGIAALIAIFASAFVGIRFAVREYPPGALALLRFGVASVLLAGVLLARRKRLPRPALRDGSRGPLCESSPYP